MDEDVGMRLTRCRDQIEGLRKYPLNLKPGSIEHFAFCYAMAISREIIYGNFPEHFKKEIDEMD